MHRLTAAQKEFDRKYGTCIRCWRVIGADEDDTLTEDGLVCEKCLPRVR